MNESRTKNTVKNFSLGAITQIINTIISFVIRTVFIKILGEEYLGVNGLFTNILTVLSFAELGIGNAIIYSMYKPIAEEDREKIKALMHLYKKTYTVIGCIVLIIGFCIIPFLNFFIKDPPNISENLKFIYLLFLLNTGLSYFFTYKKSIISANQKEYIINKYRIAFYMLKCILQVAFLLITHNFVIYLIIQIVCTFLENLLLSIKSDNMYSYLKQKEYIPLEEQEKKNIFQNVKSLVMYKFGSVILNGTDSIIISKIVGIAAVGLYSNYLLIVHAVSNVIGNALTGFTASVGNLNATAKKDKKEDVFYELLFISEWVYGFCSIALIILLNPFIEIWIGKTYLLPFETILAIALHFFVNGVQFVGYTYRTTTGLFEKGKNAPIFAALINIVLSIALGYKFGITGILFATSIARLVTTTWYDAVIVHKNEFGTSSFRFFKNYMFYFGVVVINTLICIYICNYIGKGIINFMLKGIVVLSISNLIFLLAFLKKKEFIETLRRVKSILRRKK